MLSQVLKESHLAQEGPGASMMRNFSFRPVASSLARWSQRTLREPVLPPRSDFSGPPTSQPEVYGEEVDDEKP